MNAGLVFAFLTFHTSKHYLCVVFVYCHWAGRMFAVGLGFGPVLHVWYKYLDRFLPAATISTVLKKVFVDQAVGAPVFLAYFFAGNAKCSCCIINNMCNIYMIKHRSCIKGVQISVLLSEIELVHVPYFAIVL